MNKTERFGPLAKALMTAFMAHRLGTKIATHERLLRDYPIEDVGILWIELAELAETRYTQALDAAMMALMPKAGNVQ